MFCLLIHAYSSNKQAHSDTYPLKNLSSTFILCAELVGISAKTSAKLRSLCQKFSNLTSTLWYGESETRSQLGMGVVAAEGRCEWGDRVYRISCIGLHTLRFFNNGSFNFAGFVPPRFWNQMYECKQFT